ncbi:MAG: YciC family protein [Sphingobium sp.]
MAMRLDLGRIWTDVVRMARGNAEALSAIAGMFILAPGLLSAWLLPDRAMPADTATPADLLNANADYITAHWPLILGNALIVAFGSMALLSFLLHRQRPTVAEAMRLGLRALPFYLLASAIQTLVVAGGLMLFIVPGVYLVSRFLCIAPVAVTEHQRRPLAIIARSFQLTAGNGWRIILMIAVVLLVAVVISTVVGSIVGIAASLLLPPDIARFARLLTGSVLETALAVSITLVSAAIYRATALR